MEKGKANGLSIEYNTQDFTFHYDVDKDNLKDVVKKAVKHVKKEESRYQTKKIKIVSGYKNNKLHGMLEQYWSNDKLRLQTEYKEGKTRYLEYFYKEGELESSLKCLNIKKKDKVYFREMEIWILWVIGKMVKRMDGLKTFKNALMSLRLRVRELTLKGPMGH